MKELTYLEFVVVVVVELEFPLVMDRAAFAGREEAETKVGKVLLDWEPVSEDLENVHKII